MIQIDVIKNYRIIAPNFFNFKIILALSIFENAVASRVFDFNFRCAMPWRAPVGEILRTYERVKYIKSPLSGPVNLRDYASDGYWWVHTDVVISITPKSNSSHFSTTIQTTKGDILITVYPSINGSS